MVEVLTEKYRGVVFGDREDFTCTVYAGSAQRARTKMANRYQASHLGCHIADILKCTSVRRVRWEEND